MCVSCILSAPALCLPALSCALLSLCLKMPGPHLLKYVVPLYDTDRGSTFLIYTRDWYNLEGPYAEAKWSMWEVTADGDEWWHPKTWYWAGSKRLHGPDEESVTEFWPYLSWYVNPDTLAVYTFNSWARVGGSDTWVRPLSDEGPVWWTYHCSERKEGIFWKKATWSGGQGMDWEKMHKTKSPNTKSLQEESTVGLILSLRGQAKAKAEA